MTTTFELSSLPRTRALARRLAPLLAAGDLVVLDGPLGSGQTTLARALCRALGVGPAVRVTSPTFALVHEFSGRVRIAHADLYRLENERELRELGLDAARDDGALLLVEWGAAFVDALGGDALVVALALDPRRASVTATGERSRRILARLDALGEPG